MLIEMELREIIRASESAVIVLGEKNGEGREFPLVTNPGQALDLEMAVNKECAPRPLTHDLILNVIDGMGGTLRRILVDKLEFEEHGPGGTYHGKLDIEQADGSSVWIDSRPTDAVVLASKIDVPIFVEEEVLKRVGAKSGQDEEEDETPDEDDDDDE